MFERESRKSDIIVAGGGPSGTSLAAALAKQGFETTLVDPNPEADWPNSYGGFAIEARGLGLEPAVNASFERPSVYVDSDEALRLRAAYLRFDTGRLKTLLRERALQAGVRIRTGALSAAQLASTDSLVIDATGRGALLSGKPAHAPFFQTAYGAWIPTSESVLAKTPMTLMDYRPIDDGENLSFLYAMPERDESGRPRLFVQETVLIAERPVSFDRLKKRLSQRLVKMRLAALEEEASELCLIPMGLPLPTGKEAALAFGASAAMVHPATGYQLLRTLRLAEPLAECLADNWSHGRAAVIQAGTDFLWDPSERQVWRLFAWGAHVMAGFDAPTLRQFISAFFSMQTEQWLGFMTGNLTPSELLKVMWSLFRQASPRLRLDLIRGSSTSSRHALARALAGC